MNEREIFIAARQKQNAAEREALLDEACAGDAELRRRVVELIREHEQLGSFLEHPAAPAARLPDHRSSESLGATVNDPITERPGTVIGPYRLMEQIGEGGMGLVFVAEQQQPVRRRVAMKIIKPGMDTREVIARFEAERQALALMDHPNIARVFDAGSTASGRPYFVMELVKGIPIIEYCDQQQLTARERLELFLSVCHAVQHAHGKGIIHRDLKPSNILVAPHDGVPVVKVIDFGVAKAIGQQLTDKTIYTRFTQMIGTPLYMSPEQAEINALDVDIRSDIYSLGVLLYELLTGTTPFDRERFANAAYDEIRRIIREEEPPRPSARLSTLGATLATVSARRKTEPGKLTKLVRGELDWIVMKCLEKDRNRRYETANGLAQEIQRYLHDKPVEAGPPSAAYRLRKFVRRHRRPVLAASLSLLALIGGIVGTTWGLIRADIERDRAGREADNAKTERDSAIAAREHAVRESRRADNLSQTLRRQLYFSHMNLAQAAWEEAGVGRVVDLLKQHEPQSDEEDLRGFEWHYWNRVAHASQLNLKGHTRAVYSVAFSPDGKWLASGSGSIWELNVPGEVKVWDAASGRELRSMNGHAGQVWCVAFSPDGKRLASASEDKTVKVWDAATGQEALTLKGQHTIGVNGVAFSADGKWIASASGDASKTDEPGEVKVWDATNGEEVHTLRPHKSGVYRVDFSPDSKRLASASFDRTIKLFDIPSGQETLTLTGHENEVVSVSFSPDGKRLASAGSADRTMRLWDATTGQETLVLTHNGSVWGVAFSPDGKRLASACFDKTVRIWDATSGQETLTLKGHTGEVTSVAFSPDGNRLASAGWDETVKVWDATSDPEALEIKGNSGWFARLAFSPDGKRLATVARDDSDFTQPVVVKTWDVTSGQELVTFRGHTNSILDVRYSPDGKRLAAVIGDSRELNQPGEVKVWDAASGHELLTLKVPTAPVWSMAFSPDGKLIASASASRFKRPGFGEVKVWDATTGEERFTLKGNTGGVTYVAFSPDGERLASAGLDGTVRVCDASSGLELLSWEAHSGMVISVAFSPDGKRIVSAGEDRAAKVWDATSGQELLTIQGYTDWFARVTFSPDGKRLASSINEKMVKLWDATSGQEAIAFKGRNLRLNSLAFSPDGNRLAAAGTDGRNGIIKIWDATPRQLGED